MLQLSASLLDKPVLSLRTGSPVATVTSALINPNTLKLEAFFCLDRFHSQPLILLYQDIREFIGNGYVVNDHDVLSEPSELVRLSEIISINYQLIGKPVVTISKERVGKVNDYAVDTDTMYVQKIYVSQSILKNFSGGNLSIDRNQINEITNKRIIINDLLKRSPAIAPLPAA